MTDSKLYASGADEKRVMGAPTFSSAMMIENADEDVGAPKWLVIMAEAGIQRFLFNWTLACTRKEYAMVVRG
jgi:5-keto 4-deoxyuronate isomerase